MMGYEVDVEDEVMLVFGGVALRSIEVDGEDLFNNCSLGL